ncbi:nuclear transport factor 2 family protein [Micromonospora sp. WMMD967]|uniref:nuclear transport factor 2 family protein n=1 Tax=Micromonospora sp. WMMD967 TaxID=3016101 RepID=UPI002417FFD8|nr:nuclear transport factor 2 family protein [Micromonospora sp. WMMD967]MDG4837892.1 nuclear transport factor 2 family protein [Micromonospora sp. WMMD967]
MSNDPAGVFHRGMELLLAKDMAGFIALFAEDAVLELPFAPPGQPRRVVGRTELHDYLIDYPALLDVREIRDRTVHETRDPEVIVVEFVASGHVVATGRPYELQYIAVLTIRDGRLLRYRDYWDPIAAQELLGGGLVRS